MVKRLGTRQWIWLAKTYFIHNYKLTIKVQRIQGLLVNLFLNFLNQESSNVQCKAKTDFGTYLPFSAAESKNPQRRAAAAAGSTANVQVHYQVVTLGAASPLFLLNCQVLFTKFRPSCCLLTHKQTCFSLHVLHSGSVVIEDFLECFFIPGLISKHSGQYIWLANV